MIKKTIIFTLFICLFFVVASYAADWSVYDTGHANLRLEGYQSQPGYVMFEDGNGVPRTILYADSNGELRYFPLVSGGSASSGAFDLTTTKIADDLGFALDRAD